MLLHHMNCNKSGWCLIKWLNYWLSLNISYWYNTITINKGTILGGKKSLKDNRSWYGDEAIVGGIVGLNNGKIYYCHYDGSLNITTQQQYSNIEKE